jgi:hypothetical protein
MIVTLELENEDFETILGGEEVISIDCEWLYDGGTVEECHGLHDMGGWVLQSAKIEGECILTQLENEISSSRGEKRQFLKDVSQKIRESCC